ncbi:hypothetical protein L479_02891 [Exiguobacterium sp. S17]|nr:hypothetical protein L479_02891 [Exiguobacterium sp. S17]
MRFLSSNEADWERRHTVTLLFFLLVHLYVLIHVNGSLSLLAGLVLLLLLERRFPVAMLGLLVAFALISLAPILLQWDVSIRALSDQIVRLATFLFGMVWASRFMRLERLLPLLRRFPQSTRLLYGAWALVPSMERAIRLSLRSHQRQDWREAIVVGIDSQRREPVYALPRLRSFQGDDLVHLFILFSCFVAALKWSPLIWLLYPYLTKGGVRDALVILRARTSAN